LGAEPTLLLVGNISKGVGVRLFRRKKTPTQSHESDVSVPQTTLESGEDTLLSDEHTQFVELPIDDAVLDHGATPKHDNEHGQAAVPADGLQDEVLADPTTPSALATSAGVSPDRDQALGSKTLSTSDSANTPAPTESAPTPVPMPSGLAQNKDDAQETTAAEPARAGLFGRLRNALRHTGSGLVGGVADLFSAGKVVDRDLLDELETLLLSADVGIDATDRILAGISSKLKRRQLDNAQVVLAALKQEMLEILAPVSTPLVIPAGLERPFVILMVGVNGAGKTTTIGKLTRRYKAAGRRVMLAAGDTFRAAAVEQLQTWGERHDVPVIAQHAGADSASVAFDALQSATARGFEILIADTAGRLHTQAGLMDELKKVRRVISKQDPDAPHEVLLVLDAGTGQNAVVQAEQFGEVVGVTGIVLTKLDGTAKGGVIFSIAQRLGIPIRFIGVGESAEDLREFVAEDFVDALLSQSTSKDA
jgi:fused signal recognition particle receptor